MPAPAHRHMQSCRDKAAAFGIVPEVSVNEAGRRRTEKPAAKAGLKFGSVPRGAAEGAI